ncbi:MAG: right-handed parallel beta-helix repeat-containing protein [Verrucomicrobiota bacterium]|nr:right-handed parallel beta-helix repeat-containing protein [Verrucomicrobiota bacterium]
MSLAEATATELVVNTSNPAAADTNVGTLEEPLKTISAAAAKAQPGDKVLIYGGEYRETVIVNSSGTEGDPIIFEAAPGEKPVIKGSDVITGWRHDRGSIWKSKLSFRSRAKVGSDPSFWNTRDVTQVFVRDGALLDAEQLKPVVSKNALKAGTFFCDRQKATLYVWLADSAAPKRHKLEASVRGAWLYIYGSHLVVRGLQMRHASTTFIAKWPGCSLLGDDITLDRCCISWGDFVGVSLSGHGNRLLHSVIACHGDCGIGGAGPGHLIENCRVVYNNVRRYHIDWHAGGAKFGPHFDHSILRHNEFAHNLGPGIWFDIECQKNVVDGNLAHDNYGPGIMIEISSGNVVCNNVSFKNRNPLSGTYLNADSKEMKIDYGSKKGAKSKSADAYYIGEGRGIYISSSPETKVLGNTVYANEGEGICVEGPPRVVDGHTLSTRDSAVLNNITAFNRGAQLTLRAVETADKLSHLQSDYNLVFCVGSVLTRQGWAGAAAWSLPQWKTISGQDSHSIEADPLFAMPAIEDYRLRKESPGLAAARTLSDLDHDFFGHAHNQQHSTIGACELPAGDQPQPLISIDVDLP